MKSFYLAIDLGATSGRSILGSLSEGPSPVVEMEELTRFANPLLPVAGHIFWNLPGLYLNVLEAIKKAVGAAAERGGELVSVGVDTWGVDVACFNDDATPAGLPYCYRDRHTEGAPERFFRKMSPEKLYSLTGIQIMDINTIFKLDTIRPKADKILWMPDAISFMLTGVAVAERTIASTSQMLNPATGDLDQEILATLGLRRSQFGKMVDPATVIGTLTPQIREFTGAGDVKVVAVCGHDTASAVVGIPARQPDFAFLSCGTWSLLGVELPEPVISEETRIANYTNEGGIDSSVRFLKNICGLWLFERCRAEFADGTAPSDVAALAALCDESSCQSIVDPDWPGFANPKSMTEAIAGYCRQTDQEIPSLPSDFIRVVFRSLARRYKTVVDDLSRLTGRRIQLLHAIGGGSRNSRLMQMTADELGIPVVAGPAESTALGNILVQLRACGRLLSRDRMREVALASVETVVYTPSDSADGKNKV